MGIPHPGYPLKVHFQISYVFPVFSLSDSKFSMCQFIYRFVTVTYTKLTWQTYQAFKKNGHFRDKFPKYLLPLESGNLQLKKAKFPVFWQNFQIPSFPCQGLFLAIFPVFPVQWVPCICPPLATGLSCEQYLSCSPGELLAHNGVEKCCPECTEPLWSTRVGTCPRVKGKNRVVPVK